MITVRNRQGTGSQLRLEVPRECRLIAISFAGEANFSQRISFLFTEQSYFTKCSHLLPQKNTHPVTTVPISPVRLVILDRSDGKIVLKLWWKLQFNGLATKTTTP